METISRLPLFSCALEFATGHDIIRGVKVIAVINQKGGVGKTTTVVNLGAALAARGHKVCLVDLDSQSQLTLHLGVEVAPDGKTIYDVMTRGVDLPSATIDVGENLAVVPSLVDLAAAEMELVGTVGREQVLADRFAAGELPHEFVLIDCPPSLGLLTLNALAAADELLIPMQAHFFGLQGLGRLFETVSLVRHRINPRLRVGGIVFCMYERQTRLAGEVVADLSGFLDSSRGTDVPWADARIFQGAIRRNVKLAECPSYGRTIFDYEPNSHGAEDYNALADEFLACFAPRVRAPLQAEAPVPPVETERGQAGEPVDAGRPVEPEVTAPEPAAPEPPEPPEPAVPEPAELAAPEPAEPSPARAETEVADIPPPSPAAPQPVTAEMPAAPPEASAPITVDTPPPSAGPVEPVAPMPPTEPPARFEPAREAATVAPPDGPQPAEEAGPTPGEPVQTYRPVAPGSVDDAPHAPIEREGQPADVPAVDQCASTIPVPSPWPGSNSPPPGASPGHD